MKYSEKILLHFLNPRNVGELSAREKNVGTAKVGSYETGVVIHFQLQVVKEKILAAKFKAYGACVIIAACSYSTEWLLNKTLEEALQFTSADLIRELEIPKLKIHAAILVEDAVKLAIADYRNDNGDLLCI